MTRTELENQLIACILILRRVSKTRIEDAGAIPDTGGSMDISLAYHENNEVYL